MPRKSLYFWGQVARPRPFWDERQPSHRENSRTFTMLCHRICLRPTPDLERESESHEIRIVESSSPVCLSHRRSCKPHGFALVTALSLMVLLAVACAGLLTLSSVALSNAGRESGLQATKAASRMALMVAIDQLQTHTGPDQRITTSARPEEARRSSHFPLRSAVHLPTASQGM